MFTCSKVSLIKVPQNINHHIWKKKKCHALTHRGTLAIPLFFCFCLRDTIHHMLPLQKPKIKFLLRFCYPCQRTVMFSSRLHAMHACRYKRSRERRDGCKSTVTKIFSGYTITVLLTRWVQRHSGTLEEKNKQQIRTTQCLRGLTNGGARLRYNMFFVEAEASLQIQVKHTACICCDILLENYFKWSNNNINSIILWKKKMLQIYSQNFTAKKRLAQFSVGKLWSLFAVRETEPRALLVN